MELAGVPPVSISAHDRERLEEVVHQAVVDRHPVAAFLLGELSRATIVPGYGPAGTVALNAWVTYCTDWGWRPESRILVCPQNYRSPALHLSVLSALGAAVVGLHVGGRMRYRTIEGLTHVASVESLDAPIRTYVRTPRHEPRSEPGEGGRES